MMTDPYEEWKAQGRPGGSFEAWKGSQQAAPTLPPQTAPTTATNPAGRSGMGTGSDEAVNQANQAYAQGQRGADPNQIFGQNGAQGYRDWYNQQQGGNRPEDMERFSDETIAGWDQYMIKSGPNAGKYRSMRGAPGVFDKPTECPPGQGPQGGSETDPCGTQGYSEPGPGGDGGQPQGGGGTSATPAKPALTPQQEMQQKLKEMYQNRQGQFVGQANTGQELAGGGIFWGQQDANAPAAPGTGATPPPGTPGAAPAVSAISSGSGATPLSQGVAPAPMVQAASSFASSIGSGGAQSQSPQSPITGSVAAPVGGAQPPGATALMESVKKQYGPDAQQEWWKQAV